MSELYNPANGERIAEKIEHTADDVARAVERARKAQPVWSGYRYGDKKAVMDRVVSLLGERQERLAEAITACTGKTRMDALSTEVLPAAIAARYYPRAAKRYLRPKKIRRSTVLFFNKRSYLHREPYGVVAIISPWNYPFGIPFHEVVQALVVGNAVVLKVATQAQQVGDELVSLFRTAGLPEDVLQILHVPGSTAGTAFFRAGVDKLFFTGSVATGKTLMAEASKTLTPLGLELGGNDAMIVTADANLPRAAACAAWAGISNCGQSCGGVERIYVAESVYDRFTALLRTEVERLRQGDDTRPEGAELAVDFGSLTTAAQLETVTRHVDEAVQGGAEITARSRSASDHSNGGRYYPAVVLENTSTDMEVMREETFGPVLAVVKVKDENEAVAAANDSNLGLTGSVWSRSREHAETLARRVEAGAVMVNDHLMSHGMPETPWGGYKESSLGRSHGGPGFDEMTRPKVIIHDSMGWTKRVMWWYPHDGRVLAGMRGALDLLSADSAGRKLRGALRLARLYLSRLFSS
jgi:succinate-semialdehyde dehydrogenase/glutarate-semialdehyde dehydrogenase